MEEPQQDNLNEGLIIYNASAGSGKTYTLALEYLALCLQNSRTGQFDPGQFRKVLAITFTNKAANELKERILRFMATVGEWGADATPDPQLIRALSDRIDLDPKSIQHRAALVYESMIMDYTDIHVSTIDKFVLGILRSFFKELGLTADFDIQLDQSEMVARIRDSIIEQVGMDDGLTDKLLAYLLSKAEEDKPWDLKDDLDTYLGELLKEDGLRAKDILREKSPQDIADFSEEIDQHYRALAGRIIAIQTEVRKLVSDHGFQLSDFNSGSRGFLGRMYKDLSDLDPMPESRVKAYTEGNLHGGKTTHLADAMEVLRPDFIRLLDEYNELVVGLPLLSAYRKNLLALYLLAHLDDELARIETEDALTLLSTNNSRIAAVVQGNPAPFIYERLGERFDHFLLDEFQDTSILQWHNFLPLIIESLAKGKRSFVVGDGKQSIYRWRSGEVEQFVKLPEIHQKEGNQILIEYERLMRQGHAKLPLKKNFRSKNEVIQFNNALYSHLQDLLSPELQKVYASQAQETVSPDNVGGMVEMVPFDQKALKLADSDFKTAAIERMLQKVDDCLADGYKGADIAMLVRSKADGQLLAGALRDHGLQVLSNESFFLGRQALTQVVVALMSYIDDQERVAPRLYIITQMLRLRDRADELQPMIDTYLTAQPGSKLIDFLAEMGIDLELSTFAESDLYSCCEQIIRLLGFDSSDAYLLELLHLCAERAIKRSGSLREFIAFWEDGGKESSLKLPTAEDAIQILTIHKSKGLQFPVVFIPLYRQKESQKTKDYLWVDTQDERVPKIMLDNSSKLQATPHRAIYEQEVEKNKLDMLNLLYVATTRAVDRLYLYFDTRDMGKRLSEFIEAHSANVTAEGYYLSGEPLLYKRQDKSAEKEETLTDHDRRDWRSRLRISMGRDQAFSEQRERGVVIHDVLAGLPVPADSPYLEEAEQTRAAMMALPQVANWYTGDYLRRSEAELLDETGQVHRPDTVFVSKDGRSAAVIDFKTGAMHDGHRTQVLRYKELLEGMGYDQVEAYLLYTNEMDLIQIAS